MTTFIQCINHSSVDINKNNFITTGAEELANK